MQQPNAKGMRRWDAIFQKHLREFEEYFHDRAQRIVKKIEDAMPREHSPGPASVSEHVPDAMPRQHSSGLDSVSEHLPFGYLLAVALHGAGASTQYGTDAGVLTSLRSQQFAQHSSAVPVGNDIRTGMEVDGARRIGRGDRSESVSPRNLSPRAEEQSSHSTYSSGKAAAESGMEPSVQPTKATASMQRGILDFGHSASFHETTRKSDLDMLAETAFARTINGHGDGGTGLPIKAVHTAADQNPAELGQILAVPLTLGASASQPLKRARSEDGTDNAHEVSPSESDGEDPMIGASSDGVLGRISKPQHKGQSAKRQRRTPEKGFLKFALNVVPTGVSNCFNQASSVVLGGV